MSDSPEMPDVPESPDVSDLSLQERPQVRQQRERTPHITGELLASRRVGAYHRLTFLAPDVAEQAQPGQFVALTVGGETSANLLRRCFSIHKVSKRGTDGGTVDIVVAARGPGTRWLTDLRSDDLTSIIGPLGCGFPLPTDPVPCVLVGGGYGSAPLFWLASELAERGCDVEMVLGAATKDRLFGVDEARSAEGVDRATGAGGTSGTRGTERASGAGRTSGTKRAGGTSGTRSARDGVAVTVTTDDGSMGVKGWVSTVLPDVIARSGAKVVYGCGPMAMLQSVSIIAAAHNAVAHVAVEESMACGIGVCMTCVLPVVDSDGLTRMARACVEGPVFRGDQIRWEAFDHGRCLVPEDAHGAAAMSGH